MATYIKIKLGFYSTMLVPYTTENWEMAGKMVSESTMVDTTYDTDPRTGHNAMYHCNHSTLTVSIVEMDMRYVFENSDKVKEFLKMKTRLPKKNRLRRQHNDHHDELRSSKDQNMQRHQPAHNKRVLQRFGGEHQGLWHS